MKKILFWLLLVSLVNVSYASDLVGEIQKAQIAFEADYWKFDCSINWTPVSLWALSYALAINEWGYKEWTIWHRTNNRWSLHHSQVKPIKETIHADSSKSRPVYYTVQDWLYDKLYLITHKKLYNDCKFWFNQLFWYIVWPNADPDSEYVKGKTKRQYVNDRLTQLKQQALKYDWSLYEPPLDQWIEAPTHKKECRRVANVEENEYIQIDTRIGQLRQMIFPKQKSKLFICSQPN